MADNQSCKTDCYGTRNHQTDSVAASARLLDITRHQVRGSKVGIEADEFIADLIISSPYDYLDGVSKFCATRIRKIGAYINDNNSTVLQT